MSTISQASHLKSAEKESLQSLVTTALQQAKQLGGVTAVEIDAYVASGYMVNVRLGEAETIEYNRDRNFSITVYKGQAQGSASSTDFQAEAIEQTLQAAYEIAKVTQPDSYAGLADPNLLANNYPDLDLYHPWNISVEQAISLAIDCEQQARAIDKRISNSDGASLATHEFFKVYGNSNGFLGSYSSTRHSINCMLIAQDSGGMQRDYHYTVARDPNDLQDIKEIARIAAERTVKRLHPRRLKTGKVPVIFAADVARGLLGHFVSAISGSSLYRDSSFLLNSLNKQVFSQAIQIMELPHLPKALGSVPFDNEGVALRQREIITDGILQAYVLSTYSAKKLAMQTTGNAGGVHNLTLQPNNKTFTELLKQMGSGLLITEVMGQGVNIVTGNYSRGASGFWIENGEIQYPVEEITVAGNLRDMFLSIIASANDTDMRGNIRTGSILIEQMMVAGE